MDRGFSAEVEIVAARWRQVAFAEGDWVVAADAPVGEADPVYVHSPSLGMGGVAKPRNEQPPVAQYPRAAFEKICSDLAFDLELSVPPAILWRPSPSLGLPVTTMSISLFPSVPPHLAWKDLDTEDSRAPFLPALRARASSLAVFDSWVANRDRRNDGNLIVWGQNAQRAPGVAYIDFAQSLLVGWNQSTPEQIAAVRAYPDTAFEDVEHMNRMLDRIERIQSVEEIVSRIPDDFLSADQRSRVTANLNGRRSTLRGSLVSLLSELPWEH